MTETVTISKAEYESLLDDKCFLNFIESDICLTRDGDIGIEGFFVGGTTNLRAAIYQSMEGRYAVQLLELTDLGNLIRRFRTLSNTTLEDMAKATGLSTETLSAIEFGRRAATDKELHYMACYLAGVDIRDHPYNPNKFNELVEQVIDETTNNGQKTAKVK